MDNSSVAVRSQYFAYKVVNDLKAADQDFEWYPTTQRMIDLIKQDLRAHHYYHDDFSVIDCGAGDGRVLTDLTKGKRYAIEKSEILRNQLNKEIYVVGTDFHEQTLIDKRTDVLFSNPPYLEFSVWLKKIIKEANTPLAYLILPTRWKDDPEVAELLELRRAEATVIGEDDFSLADRPARAKVDIVKIVFGYTQGRYTSIKVDPFDLWFKQNFNIQCGDKHRIGDIAARVEENLKGELVSGLDIICILEKLYNHDLDQLLNNYKAIEQIDPALLSELGVCLKKVKEGVKLKIEGLKDVYWKKLLDNLRKITDRLCSDTRRRMLDKFMQHVHVDFTASNAYAVVIWVLKFANEYFDEQLIKVVRDMTNQESVINYKSNQRTVQNENWRYLRHDGRFESLGAYKLDYRFIVNSRGGIKGANQGCNLCESTIDRINDLLTVAYNLGFDISQTPNAQERRWESNQAQLFYCINPSGEKVELAKIRCFKNGNIHFSLNQSFLCRLNVEFGRLMGWVKSSKEAAFEMDITEDLVLECFGSNLQLGVQNILQLTNHSSETPSFELVA